MADESREALIAGLLDDLGIDDANTRQHAKTDDGVAEIKVLLEDMLRQYGLSTEQTFVQKMGMIKSLDNNEKIDLNIIPRELQDAAMLPINTITDISIRQDLDMIISQVPEMYTELIITRDAICEADVATGQIARNITFDNTLMDENAEHNIMKTIEEVEDRLDLHSMIKNHVVFNTALDGEGYIYCESYAKVMEDLWKYKMNAATDKRNQSVASMFETSPTLSGYGYGESAVEISLKDAVVMEQFKDLPQNNRKEIKMESASIFTKEEKMDIFPNYSAQPTHGKRKNSQEDDKYIDSDIDFISRNIRYISENVSLPVIEESAHDLRYVYGAKYREAHPEYVSQCNDIFKYVMESDGINDDKLNDVSREFANIKGVYLRILPGTKLIPVRVDRNVIGYYYISDLTRPEDAGQRRNSGLGGYSLRSPSVGYDTFSPDRMFCERLANKIISGFNLKFMRDNVALHQQIVSILESHKFNESMMRFIFIPAENVIQCSINKDGNGKGHSMLEPGLVTARMYMFLKLYSILYQINNSEVRVYNLNMSGIDKNYKGVIQDAIRKFSARRVTTNDIFNYRSAMTKVNGGSELIMPVGSNNKPPVTFETIPASNAPINTELLDTIKNEAINATPVPSAMVQGAMSEIDFAKEVELSNTRFNSMVASMKIDLNRDITRLYRMILRWETDIPYDVIKSLRFAFRAQTAKELNITNDIINNFNSIMDLVLPTFLSPQEIAGDKEDKDNPPVVREFRKLMIEEYIANMNVDKIATLADKARDLANRIKMEKAVKSENLTDDELEEETL